MKRNTAICMLLGLTLASLPALLRSQIIVVSRYSFQSVYIQSSSHQTILKSTACQVVFIGTSQCNDTRIVSGYFMPVAQEPSELAVNETDELPTEYVLHQNYPNPFNPSTTIRFDLPAVAAVCIAVFDLQGREVARLADQRLEAGYHQLVWNGRDGGGRELPTGMYIVMMQTAEYTKSIKMALLK